MLHTALEDITGKIPYPTQEMAIRAVHDLCWLDGFIAAMAVTPKKIATATWLAIVAYDDPVRPLPKGGLDFLRESFLAAYEKVLGELTQRQARYEPCCRRDDPEQVRLWAQGFAYGMRSFPDAWRHLDADSPDLVFVVPILILEASDEDRLDMIGEDRGKPVDEFVSEAAVGIPECVTGLHRLAMKRRGAPVSALSKPGRNDPCACGSGKKYKKCCGM